MSPQTATLPEGWRDRLRPYTSPEAPGVTALCLDLVDLAVTKLCAGREKDIAWLRTAAGAALLDRGAVESGSPALPALAPRMRRPFPPGSTHLSLPPTRPISQSG